MMLVIVGCCSHQPLATLRAVTPGGRHCCRNSLSPPFLWVMRASMEVKMDKSCKVRVCQKPQKGQIWAISVHCVCQRRAKWTAFTPGSLPRPGLSLSCDPDLGLHLPFVVVWEQGRDYPAGSRFCLWLCLFFSHPLFELVFLRANANRVVNIHPKKAPYI